MTLPLAVLALVLWTLLFLALYLLILGEVRR